MAIKKLKKGQKMQKTKTTIIKKIKKLSNSTVIQKVKILVVGVGGGGCSVVSELSQDIKKADFLIINTDLQSLKELSKKKNLSTLLIGKDLTGGLGTGMNPEQGEKAATTSEKEIKKSLMGYDFIILVSCLGGGSGSGIIPRIVQISKDLNNITYGVFTYPFNFEGTKRQKISNNAINKIKKEIDSFSIILNQKIFDFIEKETGIEEAFSLVNQKLNKSLNGLIDTISDPGLINTDWADLQTIFKQEGGLSYLNSIDLNMDRLIKVDSPEEFNKMILSHSVYSYDIENANGVLLNIFAGPDISLNHINKVSNAIGELVNPNAKIIIGINDKKNIRKNTIRITLLAVGCDNDIIENDSFDNISYLGDSTFNQKITSNYQELSQEKKEISDDSYWETPTYIRKKR